GRRRADPRQPGREVVDGRFQQVRVELRGGGKRFLGERIDVRRFRRRREVGPNRESAEQFDGVHARAGGGDIVGLVLVAQREADQVVVGGGGLGHRGGDLHQTGQRVL